MKQQTFHSENSSSDFEVKCVKFLELSGNKYRSFTGVQNQSLEDLLVDLEFRRGWDLWVFRIGSEFEQKESSIGFDFSLEVLLAGAVCLDDSA